MTREEARKILGVSPGASAEELHAAYRRCAKETHPDRNPDNPQATARFQRVQEAYQTLAGGAPGSGRGPGEEGSEGFEQQARAAENERPRPPPSDTVFVVRAFMAKHDVEVLFDGTFRIASAPRMALTPEEIEGYLAGEEIDALWLEDEILDEYKG